MDWPDLAERGGVGRQRGPESRDIAPLEMNLVEVGVLPGFDEQGKLRLTRITPALDEAARALGVKALPYVPHWRSGQNHEPLPVAAGADQYAGPERAAPARLQPRSASPSRPRRVPGRADGRNDPTLDADAAEHLGDRRGRAVFLRRCRGQNTYVLETRLLAAAYRLVKEQHPGFTLRILLSQGSYPVNDQVLAEVPPDMGATFYSGTHTYDSSHKPMIYPLLEGFTARAAGWESIRRSTTLAHGLPVHRPAVHPRPHAGVLHKGLRSVTGYATPSNRFWDFNVAGLAEWAWNADGRDEHAFARAWAVRQGMADVEGFAHWACLIGPLGWDLAGSRFPMRLFWDPAKTIIDGPAPMTSGKDCWRKSLCRASGREHRGRPASLTWRTSWTSPPASAESQVVLNAYLFLEALKAISDTLRRHSPMPPLSHLPPSPRWMPRPRRLSVAVDVGLPGLPGDAGTTAASLRGDDVGLRPGCRRSLPLGRLGIADP